MAAEDIPSTTVQEDMLIALGSRSPEGVVDSVADGVSAGMSPGFLSVVRPELLFEFAEAWRQAHPGAETPGDDDPNYKAATFSAGLDRAREGDPASIGILPKVATTAGQITTAMELALDHRLAVAEWRSGTGYLQYLGSFDPQHIGHRIAVQSALQTAGDGTSAIVHVMGGHPLKSSFSAPYEARFRESEERILRSPLIDNTRVTQIDLPGGTGLANKGLDQMRLLAEVSGDEKMRWLIGSDKFRFDTGRVRRREGASKAVARFIDPNMHIYVLHRQSDDLAELLNDMDYVRNRFGTQITLVEELPYDCAPASSTQIKLLRQQGRTEEAAHMELYELTPW